MGEVDVSGQSMGDLETAVLDWTCRLGLNSAPLSLARRMCRPAGRGGVRQSRQVDQKERTARDSLEESRIHAQKGYYITPTKPA